MERDMATIVSEAELKRRELIEKLEKAGFIPPKLPHRAIYAHADIGQLPYVKLPDEGDLPLRSNRIGPIDRLR
jgi:hypothetical protein